MSVLQCHNIKLALHTVKRKEKLFQNSLKNNLNRASIRFTWWKHKHTLTQLQGTITLRTLVLFTIITLSFLRPLPLLPRLWCTKHYCTCGGIKHTITLLSKEKSTMCLSGNTPLISLNKWHVNYCHRLVKVVRNLGAWSHKRHFHCIIQLFRFQSEAAFCCTTCFSAPVLLCIYTAVWQVYCKSYLRQSCWIVKKSANYFLD